LLDIYALYFIALFKNTIIIHSFAAIHKKDCPLRRTVLVFFGVRDFGVRD